MGEGIGFDGAGGRPGGGGVGFGGGGGGGGGGGSKEIIGWGIGLWETLTMVIRI